MPVDEISSYVYVCFRVSSSTNLIHR